jgi:SAM-dependent methyltransferase
MSQNDNSYDIHPDIAEAYDRHETQTDDVELVRELISGQGPLRILEPFCGTGRILIPLAEDGHEMVGLDQAQGMLGRARAKIALLPPSVQSKITLIHADATAGNWPGGFDLVLLGGNCFYEVASPEEQEGCVASAAAALKRGGHVYVDNDHMETPLPEAWTMRGVHKTKWPSGGPADGTIFEGYAENLDCDVERRIWRARRTVLLRRPDGRTESYSFLQQKHPVSYGEVKGWLERHGFVIERTFGDRAGNPYAPDSPRAIFWARKDKG